jgi:hypothetical protein
MEHPTPYFADDARREIANAIERADDLGQAIAAQIAEAERELEEIRRNDFLGQDEAARIARSSQS